MQGGNVFHFVAEFYLATEFLYFRVSAHFQEHFIRIGNGQVFFNQAMLDQNAMIRRYCRCRWMGLQSAPVFSSVFHCTMLTGGRSICKSIQNREDISSGRSRCRPSIGSPWQLLIPQRRFRTFPIPNCITHPLVGQLRHCYPPSSTAPSPTATTRALPTGGFVALLDTRT